MYSPCPIGFQLSSCYQKQIPLRERSSAHPKINKIVQCKEGGDPAMPARKVHSRFLFGESLIQRYNSGLFFFVCAISLKGTAIEKVLEPHLSHPVSIVRFELKRLVLRLE